MSHNHQHSHSHSGDHSHSHDHGEDCESCSISKQPKLTTANDVKDVPIPQWKKDALANNNNNNNNMMAPPFGGMSWDVEASTSATTSQQEQHEHHHSAHGHTHEHMEHPGHFHQRPSAIPRDYKERAFTVGLGGPVGAGKTALMLALCQKLRDRLSIAAVTNDIFTREDGEFLTKHQALSQDRIMAVETGGCPHAAIREDISANLHACEQLTAKWDDDNLDLILLESGGDNLAANFSPELADYTIYVIDVAGGDKVPRKGGPGVTQSDLLVINKTDLAEAVGASLDVMKRDATRMRGEDGPTVFCQARPGLGLGVDEIVEHVVRAWKRATGKCDQAP